jgi:general secretion pathway protein F
MPLFKFKVADASGQVQELLIEGDNQNDATRRVQARGAIPIEFLGIGDSSASEGGGGGWGLRRKFDAADFTDRLVPLLEADIPLEKALSIIEDTAESEQERQLVAGLRRGLHEGKRFSVLVRNRGRYFPRMYASIVEAGEEAGALPRVLAQLRDFLKMSREMKNFLISSSIYPVFVLVVCFAVMIILLAIVVPKFATVLVSTAGEPEGSMAILLAMSDALTSYWWLSIVFIGIVIFLFREITVKDGPIKRQWDDIVLKLPLLGKMVVLANIGRQVRTMSILMKSGVHLLDTVKISARVLQNHRMRASIDGLASGLRRGERLSQALAKSEFVPKLVIRMLNVGEETGATDEMLARVADRYDEDLKQTIKRLLAWFEPLVIILLGGVVGSIVMMLFLAVMDMQQSF